jgi:hypothetical protein
MKKSVLISGEDEAIDELVEMLKMDEAHSGDHIYKIKKVKSEVGKNGR